MKRCLALALSALMAMIAFPVVSADSYNDDQFEWGEYACPHTHIEEVAEIPSTCLAQGRSAYTRCLDCKLLLSGSRDPLPLGDHAYDNACDVDCNVCGDLREITHSYDSVVTAPDCENSGYTVHTCTACGYSYVDGRVNALGHNYQVTENMVPTCVADGKKVYVCANCGDGYTEVVPATGKHVYDYDCDEICNVCGYQRNDAHHFIFDVSWDPTCGEYGVKAYKCWNCDAYRYDYIPPTGNHKYSGACDAKCNVCNFIRDDVAAHSYALTDSVELTCVTDGVNTYTCRNCGDSYTETITAVGHKYDIVITAPDCESGGYTTHTCTACGDVIVDNRTDALGHAYDSVVTAPTCAAEGYTTHTCSRCGDSYVDSPEPATGEHTYDGDKDADCNVCGHVRPIVIPGDVDGNGKVNNRDLGVLLLYLNDDDISGKKFDDQAADLDGNGRINNRDLGLLQKLLNDN